MLLDPKHAKPVGKPDNLSIDPTLGEDGTVHLLVATSGRCFQATMDRDHVLAIVHRLTELLATTPPTAKTNAVFDSAIVANQLARALHNPWEWSLVYLDDLDREQSTKQQVLVADLLAAKRPDLPSDPLSRLLHMLNLYGGTLVLQGRQL